jgi:hypothetical protein
MMVFSPEWFEEHQRPLLRFANSRWGRYVLRINGSRSAVGSRTISNIEPHAISWLNEDGTQSSEFRAHAKFAKRLYHAFKPFWFLMHAWDLGIANHLTEALNLGFDTLTSYPDSGHSSTTVDGYAYRYTPGSEETWSTISAGLGTDYFDDAEALYVEAIAGTAANKFVALARSLLTFDTTSIHSLDTVTAASLSLYLNYKDAGLGETAAHVVSGFSNQNNRLAAADYQRVGSTSFSSVAYSSLPTATYSTFTLNSSGRSNITKGGISGFGLRLGWDVAGSFTGTWLASQTATYGWQSVETTGSSEDPTLLVTYTVARSTSVSGSLLIGSSLTTKTTHRTSLSGSLLIGANVDVTKAIAPVPGKEYVYRIYDADSAYIGTWNDVASDLTFSQRLNTPGTTTTVRLARSANRTIEQRTTLSTEAGEGLTDESGDALAAAYVTNNTIGEGTDVELNYRVDIYAHYGTFENLLTEDGEFLLAEEDGGTIIMGGAPLTIVNTEDLLVAVGAPLGRRVFSGIILDYSANYGQREFVDVTLASHGIELSNEVILSGTDTTVSYAGQPHDTIVKSILDTNPGVLTYDSASIDATATNINETFRLNTKLEGVESVYSQTDDGWYWYGNVGDNNLYLKNRTGTADHTLVFAKHISEVLIKRTMEDLRNTVYFVGGDTGAGILYKKYTDPTSVAAWRQGVYRITDRRYILEPSAARKADKILARYGGPIYTTSVTISSEVYDIESIQLGQMVGFANFDNFVDSLVLQIVRLSYSPYHVTIDLGELLDRQADVVDDIAGDLQAEQFILIPAAPS